MKNHYVRESRPWLIWLTIIAVVLAGVGIFFYYNLFRQSKSELIEAIPTDAAFIFALNDNDVFVKGTARLAPYLDELFVLDALPAYESMRGKLPSGEYDLTVSGHGNNGSVSVLFNTHADKAAFKRLLRALSIDPNNYTAFEGNRIYTYGTNFKSMKFTYVNHIISFSTDMDLLKRAIVQRAHPKNLLSDKQFKEMYDLSEKNRKQNWLMVNPQRYASYISSFLKENLAKTMSESLKETGWTALQLRFSGNEMFLSGYMFTNSPDADKFDILKKRSGDGMEITDLYPDQCQWYAHLETPRIELLDIMHNFTREESEPLSQLQPHEIGYFSLCSDSVDYKYVILYADTTKNVFDAFYGEKADSVRIAHPDGIYPVPHNLAKVLKIFAPDSVKCFLQRGCGVVLAPSADALKAYQKSVKNAGTLSQNRYYPFVNEAIASSSVFNFVIFNNEGASNWLSHLSDKGQVSQFGQNLRVFSLSCETMEKGKNLVPINLFLHF